MLREERLNGILAKIRNNQSVSSTDLMQEFKVSEGTIRRDLNELEGRGLLQKVHGGAISRPQAPKVLAERQKFAGENKDQLAQKALPLLKEGQLILMDGGSTNWHLARIIPHDLSLTIYTNSFLIVNELMNHPSIRLHFLGGSVFKSSQVTVGHTLIDTIRNLHADMCFVGIRGIHPKHGITSLDQEEVYVKQAMVKASNKTVLMATGDKFDVVDHYKICGCEEIDTLVVENGTGEHTIAPYSRLGIQIL